MKPENVLLCIPPVGEETASQWWSRNREGAAGRQQSAPERLRKGWSKSWPAPKDFRAKLVDLGNACPEDRPFTDDIQTIEYRCPEVVVGAKFDAKVMLELYFCIYEETRSWRCEHAVVCYQTAGFVGSCSYTCPVVEHVHAPFLQGKAVSIRACFSFGAWFVSIAGRHLECGLHGV